MKKIIFLNISIILFFYISSCSGYKPIYSTSNFNFKIEDYSIQGEERLANIIYRKLYDISLSNKDNQAAKSIILSIETKKDKRSTVKNNAGKILEYEINLITKVIITDYITDKKILDKDFIYSISYKVQDEHSETLKLENKNIENLTDKTFQDLLIKISEIVALQ